MYYRRALCCTLVLCLLHAINAQQTNASLPIAAQTLLMRARQLLQENDAANAVILLESQLSVGRAYPEYVQTTIEAYRRQFDRLQRDGKLPQATQIWEKLNALQPQQVKPDNVAVIPASTQKTPAKVDETSLQAAEIAFQQGQFSQASAGYEKAQAGGTLLDAQCKERFAYCKLHLVAEQLNSQRGQVAGQTAVLEREIQAALALAPRLQFGQELLQRLHGTTKRTATSDTGIKHLEQKEQGWQIAETTHFRVYHQDQQLAEQVAQIAESTRAAVIRKWLGQDIQWQQPCQIFVHPTADSYHRQSGMPTTAPGHSDYDADKNDASIIHYRRVFVRADHAHMLSAILPHEVTHVVLNGQFGRKLLPRWADEGMAVLSEPYSRIAMHLTPLPQAYQENRSLSLSELFRVEDYPQDRSKVASFYGQSVCLVEYLCSLKGAQGFVSFMRDANREGEAAALERNYGLTLQQLESRLGQWIVKDRMPTLLKTEAMR